MNGYDLDAELAEYRRIKRIHDSLPPDSAGAVNAYGELGRLVKRAWAHGQLRNFLAAVLPTEPDPETQQ